MSRFLLALLLADTSGRSAPIPVFPELEIRGPVGVPEGSSDELLACARAWSQALGLGGFVIVALENPG